MPLYRKKPVVVSAIKFMGIEDNEFMGTHGPVFDNEVPVWLKHSQLPEGTTHMEEGEWTWNQITGSLLIKTLEGVMIAKENDYIIQGVNGEIYPCKPDIFELTYERVLDE